MPALRRNTLLKLRSFLSQHMNTSYGARDLVTAIDVALKPKRSVLSRRKEKMTKREAEVDEWCAIKEQVFNRAMGACESCGKLSEHLEPDHMFGGFGRRKTLQGKYTVWALCRTCHYQKTNNGPSAKFWLTSFIEHCGYSEGSGYLHAADIARKRLEFIFTKEQFKKEQK